MNKITYKQYYTDKELEQYLSNAHSYISALTSILSDFVYMDVPPNIHVCLHKRGKKSFFAVFKRNSEALLNTIKQIRLMLVHKKYSDSYLASQLFELKLPNSDYFKLNIVAIEGSMKRIIDKINSHEGSHLYKTNNLLIGQSLYLHEMLFDVSSFLDDLYSWKSDIYNELEQSNQLEGMHRLFPPTYPHSSMRKKISSMEIFRASDSIMYRHLYYNDISVVPIAIFELRQAIEIRLLEILGIVYLRQEDGTPAKITANLFWELDGLKDNIIFPVPVCNLRKIYKWSNFFVHSAVAGSYWKVEFARYYLADYILSESIMLKSYSDEIPQLICNKTKISVENIIKQTRTKVAVISDKKEFDCIKTRIEEIGYHRCQEEKAKEMADSLKNKQFQNSNFNIPKHDQSEKKATNIQLIGSIIVPHPPIIIPTVGRGREVDVQTTIDAYRAAAKQAAAWSPEVLIVTSPHTVMYADYFHISPGKDASGDMSAFGASQTKLEAVYDTELRQELVRQAEAAGIQAGTLGEKDPSLDHGTFLPLYFLREAGVNCPILRIGLSGFSPLEHYRLGQCIARAVDTLGRRAVFVASGDLSHKLKGDGPYGYAPEGPVFDRRVTQAMDSGDFLQFLTMDASLCDRAAECGLRSFQIMAGALDGLAVSPKLLSYEGTFGVGYGVATFAVTGPDEDRRFGKQCEELEHARLAERKASEDPWVRLARLSLETYVKTGKRLERLPDGLPGEMTGRAAGAFVSLHTHGQLRGCIGTTGPTTASVAWEIVQTAVSACSRDPRFPPVGVHELDSLEYSVDVLGQPEPIDSPDHLDVKRYGVIVSCGDRRGLLLPDLEGVDTVEQQIDIARQKGGISSRERYTLERFEVVRHT